MINVNQITSQLARMPDQALQQYAQMHKNDPYIMALAMSESNRRKTMRTGAQMNAPEEPKVVDQAIQGMAAPMPENIGIGQLPAGEMNFAEGGIVAFSGGGDVPRFNDKGLVQSYPNRIREFLLNRSREIGRASPFMGALLGTSSSAASGLTEAVLAGKPPEVDAQRAGEQVPPALRAQYLREAEEMGFGKRMQFSPEIAQVLAAATAAKQKADLQRELDMAKQRTAALGISNAAPVAAPAAAAAPPSVLSAPSAVEVTGTPAPRAASSPGAQQAAAAAAAKNRSPAAPAAPAAAAAASSSFVPSQAKIPTMDEIKGMYETNMPKPEGVTDPFAAQRQELTNLATLQNAQEQSDYERQVKERGVLGEKQEKRLKAREEKLGKQEKDLGPLAMLQAGFAIMGGSSRSALQNIGAGAGVGLKGYTDGIEKLQTARERIEDGLERIETARRSEGMMDNQQRNALKREGNTIVREGKKDGINALTTELGVRRAQATSMINSGITALTEQGKVGSAERLGAAEMQNRVTVANIGAAATGANAAATRAATEGARMAALAENVRKNIADEAVKKFPYSTTDQATYQQQAMQAALRSNPGLAQYLGVSGGGGAPAAETATHRLNPATGKIEPVR